jgi:hypothetical protein
MFISIIFHRNEIFFILDIISCVLALPKVLDYLKKGFLVMNTLAFWSGAFDDKEKRLKTLMSAYWVPDEECVECYVCSRTFERAAKRGPSSLQVNNIYSEIYLIKLHCLAASYCESVIIIFKLNVLN